MATWPTSKPDSTKFDSDNDRISTSRPELKTMSDAVNDIVDFIQPSGITDTQVLAYDSASATMIPADATADYTALTFGIQTESATSTTGTIGASNKVEIDGDKRIIQISVTSGGGLEKIGVDFANCIIGVTYIVYLSCSPYGQVSVTPYDGASILDSTGGTTQTIEDRDYNNLRWAFKVTKVAISNNRYLVEWDGYVKVFDI